jgi:predicted small secreted protein
MRVKAFVALTVVLVLAALVLVSCGNASQDGIEGQDAGGDEIVARNDLSFLVCGDPHGRTDLLADIVGQAREGEFLVIVGDITTGKGLTEMEGMKDFLDASGVEYFVIPGDNDMPGGDLSVFKAVFGPDYYSADVQDLHLVFLNDAIPGVGCPEGELAWLREDLKGVGDSDLVLAFAHVPPGAPVDMGGEGFVEAESDSAREMQEILRQAGAPVLYCGHLHAYMIYGYGPPRVVVTGGAGGNPHLSEEAGGYHHFLRVTVRDNEVSEEVIRL